MKPSYSLVCVRAIVLSLLLASLGRAASYVAVWDGNRNWVGPDYWTIRWQDWSVDGGKLHVESRPRRSAVLMTHEVEPGDGTVDMRVTVLADENASVAAGFWAGVKGPVNDWRSAACYGDYRIFAGMRPDGTLVLRNAGSDQLITLSTKIDPKQPVELHLRAAVVGARVKVELRASQNNLEAGMTTLELDGELMQGLIGLGTSDQMGAAAAAGAGGPRWHFERFSAEGDRLAQHDDRTFGPIGWTQYTCTSGVLKLTALMLPVGSEDSQTVSLLLEKSGSFEVAAESTIDPISRTAHFRVENIKPEKPLPYRVRYVWQGKTYTFDGLVRSEPTGITSVAVMSCDWGYAFPNTPIVTGALAKDPDFLVYAGDQIYEHFGKFGPERRPLDRAALDYLRRYALFGIVNRDLLRDRPSVIIPDDHDVFQGNIWGAGGIKQSPGGDEMGGYQQSAEWLNAMQRTQCWHLPDAVDPTPVAQGITVYYGGFTYGNVAFAVLEDRKWKTGFRSLWRSAKDIPTDLDALDPPGTSLLGDRQEQFLADWAKQHPELIHVAISQTSFAKAHTHSGPQLNRNTIDFDTNGWPRTPRNRAVKLLGDAGAIHLCGDQHVGVLMQMGAETWNDGPLTFMVPGTANGWPRAWWPKEGGSDRIAGAPPYTGNFRDAFGNRMSLYAVANPLEGANQLTAKTHSPDQIAQAKGSGYGIVRLDPVAKTATFEMLHYLADPTHPKPDDQFEGFPKTFQLSDKQWMLKTP